jgi:hypothetical protein
MSNQTYVTSEQFQEVIGVLNAIRKDAAKTDAKLDAIIKTQGAVLELLSAHSRDIAELKNHVFHLGLTEV